MDARVFHCFYWHAECIPLNPRPVSDLYLLQGSVPAITALGWYYEQYEKDYEKAVHLWEEADVKGHPDAALNLGVFYSQGLYPGQPADQVNTHMLMCFYTS